MSKKCRGCGSKILWKGDFHLHTKIETLVTVNFRPVREVRIGELLENEIIQEAYRDVIEQMIENIESKYGLGSQEHSCKKCMFFSRNTLLYCAVRPSGPGVKTSTTNDCSDWKEARF